MSPLGKDILRTVVIARRRAWAPLHRESASAALCERLLDSDLWKRAQELAGFVGTALEVDTRPLLERALLQGKAVWLPAVTSAAGEPPTMEWRRLRTLDELTIGRYRLWEPPEGAPTTTPDRFDLVLVPGLAFWRSGHRLGRGGGYYDRALASVAGREVPVRVGVCPVSFLEPSDGSFDPAPHDVAMHTIATDAGSFECR